MDESAFPLAERLIGRAYAEQGRQALRRREGLSKALLSSRRLPLEGWDDASIEFFLSDLALMDSNNFIDNVRNSLKAPKCQTGYLNAVSIFVSLFSSFFALFVILIDELRLVPASVKGGCSLLSWPRAVFA
jgi:hypothetical protein